MASIYKRGPYQYEVKIRRKGHPMQTRTFEYRKDAEAWARSVERDIDHGEFKSRKNAANTTLAQVLEHYRDNIVPGNKGKDVDKIRLRILLKSDLAKYSMAALSHDVIEAWCNSYAKDNKVKGSTINRYLNTLSAAISIGIKKKKLNIENPVAMVDRPANPIHRDRRIYGEEEKRLLDALSVTARNTKGQLTGPSNPWLRPLVEFALETAMRRSELLGLEWKYVDKTRKLAHIPDTKIGKGDEAPVSRNVPLSQRALDILEELPRSIGGKVFPTTPDAVKKSFSRAVARARKKYEQECEEAGEMPLARMLVDLHFHDLRHEATSRLAKIYDIRQLAKVGGWTNLNTLARYYNPTDDELVEKLHKAKKLR